MNIQSVNHTATSKQTSDLNVNTNLGFRYSSLSAIMSIMRASTNTGGQLCVSNRSHGNLKSYQINIGGQKYPQKAIQMETNNHSEVLAELLLMKNVLMSKKRQPRWKAVVRERPLPGAQWMRRHFPSIGVNVTDARVECSIPCGPLVVLPRPRAHRPGSSSHTSTSSHTCRPP